MTIPDAPTAAPKVLRIGLISAVQNLDPSRAQDFVSLMAVAQIFERPFAVAESGQPAMPILFREGLQAESSDQTVFSGAVREDILFSDGTPLDSTAPLAWTDAVAIASPSISSTPPIGSPSIWKERSMRGPVVP